MHFWHTLAGQKFVKLKYVKFLSAKLDIPEAKKELRWQNATTPWTGT